MIHTESFQRILDANITSKKIFEMFSQLTNATINLAKEYPEQVDLPTVSLNWTETDEIEEGTLIPVLSFAMVPFNSEMRGTACEDSDIRD